METEISSASYPLRRYRRPLAKLQTTKMDKINAVVSKKTTPVENGPGCYRKVISKKNIFKLYDDVFLHILKFLGQYDITLFSQVCKDFYRLRGMSTHLDYYFIYNSQLAKYAQNQSRLKAVVINGFKDVQTFFNSLPEYVFLGQYSSFHPANIYQRMVSGPVQEILYNRTKVLFVEEAHLSVDWGCFPNLEELYILTSQQDLNIDNLWKCTKLKKVIIKIRQGILYVENKKVTELPNLEIFAVSGKLTRGKFRTTSNRLHTCIFFSTPEVRQEGVFYSERFTEEAVCGIDVLFQMHHIPPAIITNNIRRMYNHSL